MPTASTVCCAQQMPGCPPGTNRAPELSETPCLKRPWATPCPRQLIEGGPAARGYTWAWPWARWPGAWPNAAPADPDPNQLHSSEAGSAGPEAEAPAGAAQSAASSWAARAKISKPAGALTAFQRARKCFCQCRSAERRGSSWGGSAANTSCRADGQGKIELHAAVPANNWPCPLQSLALPTRFNPLGASTRSAAVLLAKQLLACKADGRFPEARGCPASSMAVAASQ